MKRSITFLCAVALLGAAACSPRATSTGEPVRPNADGRPAAWTGVYGARLPAASSPGRDVALLLRADSSAVLHTDFLNGEAPVVETGTWRPEGDDAVRVHLTQRDDLPDRNEITFRRSGDTLSATVYDETRYGRNGLTLARRPAPALAGTAWRAEYILGRGVLDSTASTVTFGADGRITGRAACNSFGGTYDVDGARIATSRLVSTRMACAPAAMDQEQRFLAALEKAEHALLADTGLLWLYSSGERAPSRFSRLEE